ncbi:MAG: SAM-dependent chlorinase/fluorinase [Thermoflexales bacterium]|nr:SAM-dependent chlorinase/fluorinase [Thermoflexales bacterium]
MITLTTDFGLADGYVGAMKGVILSIAPGATLVDISHDIAPGNIRQAAFVLHTAAPYFPGGTIHVVVVDPGVGNERRAIAARGQRAIFVAPDNGVLSLCLAEAGGQVECRHVSNPAYHLPRVSSTFHGRDIFAPAAAHLLNGAAFDELGPLVPDPLTQLFPAPTRDAEGRWQGEVWHVDHFGNLITNLQPATCNLQTLIVVEIAGQRIAGLACTYAERAPGELLALVGSSGYLEIAVRDGSAARRLNAQPGTPLRLYSK